MSVDDNPEGRYLVIGSNDPSAKIRFPTGPMPISFLYTTG